MQRCGHGQRDHQRPRAASSPGYPPKPQLLAPQARSNRASSILAHGLSAHGTTVREGGVGAVQTDTDGQQQQQQQPVNLQDVCSPGGLGVVRCTTAAVARRATNPIAAIQASELASCEASVSWIGAFQKTWRAAGCSPHTKPRATWAHGSRRGGPRPGHAMSPCVVPRENRAKVRAKENQATRRTRALFQGKTVRAKVRAKKSQATQETPSVVPRHPPTPPGRSRRSQNRPETENERAAGRMSDS